MRARISVANGYCLYDSFEEGKVNCKHLYVLMMIFFLHDDALASAAESDPLQSNRFSSGKQLRDEALYPPYPLLLPGDSDSSRISLVGVNLERILTSSKTEVIKLLNLPDHFKACDRISVQLTANLSSEKSTDEHFDLTLFYSDENNLSKVSITRSLLTHSPLLAK